MKKKNKFDFSGLVLVGHIGYVGITPILVGVFLGGLLDDKIGTKGIFMIIFIVLGAISGLWNIYRITDQYNKRK